MNVVSAIDGPASFYYIFQEVSDVNGFLKWLRESLDISETTELLSGYKFLLGSIVKGFMNEIYVNSALGLTEDEAFFRAQFKGVPLGDTPNTCEKTILLKRVWTHGRAIAKSKAWQELDAVIVQAKTDLEVFRQLIENHCKTSSPHGKDFVIQAIAADHIFTLLNDTSHNIPLAELVFPSITPTATEKSLFDAFPGYVYGLQFLWYSVLGAEEFGRACVKDLHLALDEEEVKKHSRIKSHLQRMLEGEDESGLFKMKEVDESELSEEAKDFMEVMRREGPARSERWAALDRFWGPIQEEIVRPREAKLGTALGMSHLLVLDGYTKDLLSELLDPSKVADADYLTNTDDASLKKRLSLKMLWYDVNVLDTQSLLVFNGAPAFASTLLGSVELARAFRREDPVKAIVFKHPAGWENHFDYSFGVFIQAYGSTGVSDYSGWLIFFDCATDHSGFGGSMLSYARTAIEIGKRIGQISTEEIEVDKALFKEFLREHSVSSVFDTLIKETPAGGREIGSLNAVLRELDDFLSKSKGKLFEHVVHKWMSESQGFEKTFCDTWVNGEQVDCVGEIGGSISCFDCKIDVHKDTIDDTLTQIKRKVAALSKENQKVEAVLAVYTKIPLDVKAAFEKSGIFVKDDFRGTIIEDKCFDRSRDEKLGILDWQFRTPGRIRPEF